MRELEAALRQAIGERYAIEARVGIGGMGTVFRAHDVRHGRPVALKALRPELAAHVGGSRFLREIGISARLQHPHIVPLFDSGETNRMLWYTMPFLEEQTLRHRLHEKGRLNLHETVRIGREIAAALDYAHARGVVHRDIKPENILFSAGHAMVADFGVARAIEQEEGEDLTTPGFVIGSPSYMAPEQVKPHSDVGPAADIYSLGCVLYECLAGHPPFGGPSRRSVMEQHLNQEPPSLRGTTGVPPRLEAAIMRALGKDPEKRFRTAAELGEALRRYRRPSARPKVLAGTVAGVLLGTVLWFGASRISQPNTIRSIAVLPFTYAGADSSDAYLSDGMAEEIYLALARVPGLQVASRTATLRLRDRDGMVDPREAGQSLGVSAVVEGNVRRDGAQVRLNAQLVDARNGKVLWSSQFEQSSRDLFTLQDQLALAVVDQLQLRLGEGSRLIRPATSSAEAYDAYLRGKYFATRRTTASIVRGIREYERAIAIDPQFALGHAALAEAWGYLDGYGDPKAPELSVWPAVARYARRALELDSSRAEIWSAVGFSRIFSDWDWAGAEAALDRAIVLDSSLTQARVYRAWVYAITGRLHTAVAELRRARALDPLSLVANTRLGSMLYFAREPDAAIAQLRQTIELDSTYHLARAELARVYAQQGRLEEAVALYRILPPEYMTRYEGAGLGYVLARRGRVVEARSRLQPLTEGGRRRSTATAALLIHVALGDTTEALDWLEWMEREKPWATVTIGMEPMLDPLRTQPRFQAVMKRLGIPESKNVTE
jgi:TolB-like protein/Tfp pilus assembly protein PilF